jgi:hypothetical protein
MKRYEVIATVQSRMPGSEPVEIPWYRGEDPMRAVAALVQVAAQVDEVPDPNMPDVMRTDVKSVRMDMFDVPLESYYAETVLSERSGAETLRWIADGFGSLDDAVATQRKHGRD